MIEILIEPLNYPAVFGIMLGFAFVIELEALARNAVIFMKGWKS